PADVRGVSGCGRRPFPRWVVVRLIVDVHTPKANVQYTTLDRKPLKSVRNRHQTNTILNTSHEPKSTTVLELKYRSYEMFTIIQEFTEKYRGFRGSLFSIHPLSGCERLLDLEGAVVTIDAMGCQKDIAAKIVGGGGQYVLAVKENQPHLYEDIERAFDEALDQGEPGVDFTECQTEGPRKGRQETRTCCVITNPKGIRDAGLWTGLTAIVMVISERVVNGVAGSETRYFIGSVARTAEEYLRWIRGHWGIENSLHWVLDVCFCEDDQRHWAGNSAENLGWLRKLALCLLKAEKSRSSKGK